MKMNGSLVAIPVPWEHTATGCVEWRLIDWTLEDDNGHRLPVLIDGGGEMAAWAGDYAVQLPEGAGWRFPDGELSDDENLIAAFQRRQVKH